METDFEYQYKNSSTAVLEGNEKQFSFSHCSEIREDDSIPCFFYGNILNSYVAAKCMSVLAKMVGSHFTIAPGLHIYLRDPIISVGNQELHFEAFSSCNGVYARVDILQSGIDGEFIQSGCTNIDFNDNTIRAFNTVKPNERLSLSIGSKKVAFTTEKNSTIEKKVSLPNRWIKGLSNVQAYLSEMELAFQLTKIESLQLFKTLPKTAIKGDYYLTKSGLSYQFSSIPKSNYIKIGGIHRLNLLQNLLFDIDSLSFYKCDGEQSVAIILAFKGIQMLFLFSENVYRGFSGEGKNLPDLITEIPDEWLLGINSFFKTNEVFNPTLVAIENDIDFNKMTALQSSLSSIGLIGFDILSNRYFYRRLPFKLERLKNFNPRIQNAKKLIENDEVKIIEQSEKYLKAEVKGSSDINHIVIKSNSEYLCTCTWFTNHQHKRGFCKHILAVKMKEGF